MINLLGIHDLLCFACDFGFVLNNIVVIQNHSQFLLHLCTVFGYELLSSFSYLF